VTVCIAAFAEHENQLVFVSDSRVAFGDFSTDKGAVKYELLENGYLALIAGNDVVYALPAIRRARARVLKVNTRDPDEIAAIVHEELRATKDQIIESKILGKYKITAEQFSKNGRRYFTEQVFYDIYSRIEQEHLSLSFIVAGFDASKKAHIRVVTANEPPHDFDALGYAAIGTGAPAALASLSFAKDHDGFGRDAHMEDVSYYLLAAKFMAESATDVGRDTYFLSLGHGRGIYHLMTIGGMDALRKSWEKTGAPRNSKPCGNILKDILYENREHFLGLAVLTRCFKYFNRRQRKAFKIMMEPDFQKKLMGSPAPKGGFLTQSDSQRSEDQQ
jgi:hypothetical protein